MNSTVLSSGELNGRISGFHYLIGISVGVIIIITSMAIASYYCTRIQNSTRTPQQILVDQPGNIEVGLDAATIKNYPKLLYSEAMIQNKHIATSCCSICLANYNNADTLRLLPDCGHLFHLKCVDPWLLQHPTCPLCRSSPMTTPKSTPLAEIVPLANRMV